MSWTIEEGNTNSFRSAFMLASDKPNISLGNRVRGDHIKMEVVPTSEHSEP